MASPVLRSLFSNILTSYQSSTTNLRTIHTSSLYYAARKGTRAKARAKKVKVEVTKVGFIPHNQRGKDKKLAQVTDKFLDDSFKSVSTDDVFPMRYYRWIVYTAEDAVRAHQETHHPTMYNQPDALVFAKIELNMQAAKKNRFIETYSRLTLLPHPFPRDEERTILAFCKSSEDIKAAMDAGATTVGGQEIIKKIQDGSMQLSDYEYVVAHPNILTELVPIRGLMKRRFPSIRMGTLDPDIAGLVKKFSGGIQYRIVKDEHQPSYGCGEIPVGRLNMDAKIVAENIAALLKDIQAGRPKRDGLFLTKCLIVSPPSTENLKIDPFVYVDRTLSREVQEDSDDEEEVVARAAA